MDINQALEIIDVEMAAQVSRPLSEAEIALLVGAWKNQTYEQIAEASGYSLNYLQRDAGPRFWKLLSDMIGQKLNKTTAPMLLTQWAQQAHKLNQTAPAHQHLNSPSSVPPPSPSLPSPLARQTDWGEALDVSTFYARTEELSTLKQWIVQDRCRLIALLGMGGIGKSSLAAKTAELLANQFEYVIWRSLRNAPPLPSLLAELVPFLSGQQDIQAKPDRLMHWLRTHRCLVILDNVETILQAGDRAGYYQPDYEDYGDLLRLIGETAHQSCVLLTSREKPAEVAVMEGLDAWVRSLPLRGSAEAALALIETRNLLGTESEKQRLCRHYDCNPLALKIVATSIESLFDGEIAPFLEQETAVFNGLRRLLEQQFERLSWLEQTIMYWLAINREWTTIPELIADIIPTVTRAQVLETLESLTWRSLIEKKTSSYTQQPVVMEYVTAKLTEQITTELITKRPAFLNRFALIKTTVKNYIRESQSRLVLGAIAERIRANFSHPATLHREFQELLRLLQRNPELANGYSGGNLLNLYCYLQLDLEGVDLSNLTIRHAYLLKASLNQINLSGVNFIQSTFTETFGCVLGIDISISGALLAVGDSNCDVCIRQAETGQLLLLCQGHTDCVWSVAFSPDEQLLASGSHDRTIKLWQVQTGQCVQTLEGHQSWVASVDWHPNGQLLASGSTDCTVRLWDIETGQCRVLSHPVGVLCVAWHPNGQFLATGCQDQVVRIWDTNTGKCVQTLPGHTSQIWTVAWSPLSSSTPDSHMTGILASGSFDQTIRIWDVASQQCLTVLHNPLDPILKLAWHPTAELLASGSFNRAVKLWNPAIGQCFKTLQGHVGEVFSLAWTPDGSRLFSGSQDQVICCWDAATGDCLNTLQGYLSRVWSVAWSPDGQQIATACQDQLIRLWDRETGQCSKTLFGHTSLVQAVAWHPAGELLASSACDLAIKIWNSNTGECLKTLLGHAGWIWSVDWNPDGSILASSGTDQTIRLWDLQQGCIAVLPVEAGQAWSVAWSPDGTRLANSGGQKLYIWEAATGHCLAVLGGHTDQVIPVKWRPDGRLLASAGLDRTIRLWNQAGECLSVMTGHSAQIFSLAWHPTGQYLASAAFDRTVRLWHLETDTCTVLQGHTERMTSIAFSPDGTLLASGGDDKQIQIWETSSKHLIQTLQIKRPYEGMNITGITGVTNAQKATLKKLGALESTDISLLHH